MARTGFTIDGVKEMAAKFRQIAGRFPEAERRALRQEAEIEMTESKKRCPVYSPPMYVKPTHVGGTLRASGHVTPAVTFGTKTLIDLVYGGAAETYAIVQHETEWFHHNVGQWRFLASVLEESEPYMAGRIAIRLHLRGLL